MKQKMINLFNSDKALIALVFCTYVVGCVIEASI